MRDKIRVLVADREPHYRGTVLTALGTSDEIEIVAESVNAPQTIVDLARFLPDVVLVDMALPGDATRVIEWVSRAVRGCRVLAILEQADEMSIIRVLNAGASGYVSRTSTDAELIDGIKASCRGEFVMPPGMLSTLLRRLSVGARKDILGRLRAQDELRLERDEIYLDEHRIIKLDALDEARSRNN